MNNMVKKNTTTKLLITRRKKVHLQSGTQVVPLGLIVKPGQHAETVRIFGTI